MQSKNRAEFYMWLVFWILVTAICLFFAIRGNQEIRNKMVHQKRMHETAELAQIINKCGD